MVRPFDVSKFRKSVTKSIGGISVGFESDPVDWVDTGNYCLNYLISGDFNKGIPLGRVTMLAGESGSGKSLIASGNIIKNAQKESETNIIKINDQFHSVFENRKKMAEDKIKQMKLQATKEIKNYSVEVAIIALEKIIKNSVDKKKLDKIYISSIDEAKKILKNKSI